MVPFKPYFLGQETPPYDRAVSVQKCVRTPDIEDVGKTTRHGTFFEMCGNFSFGDYFKEGAIELAWDLVTRSQADGGFGLEESRLWPSILHGDDEALHLWMKVTGLPAERIVKLGPKENYWSMGVPGPGRPVLGDPLRPRSRARSRRRVRDHRPDRDAGQARGPLPGVLEPRLHAGRAERGAVEGGLRHRRRRCRRKNIDTGMGLERVAYLLQGVDNMYEIDVMYPVIERAEELGRYGAGTARTTTTTSASGSSPTTSAAR